MQFVAAYLLLALGGKESPTADEVKGLLEKAGVEVDADKLAAFVKGVEGKNVNELLEKGQGIMKQFAGAGGSGGGSGDAGAAAEAEEEKVEEEEAEVDLGGGGMFGGDDEGY